MSDKSIGQLAKSPVFWHLDVYQTSAEAEADKQTASVVFKSFGKIWLMSIDGRDWWPRHGTHVGKIGPLPIVEGHKYSAQYLEAVFTPGMTSRVHVHGGPEAWYMVAGESCVESSDGRIQLGRPGGKPVIVPVGLAMLLTATGTQERRAIALVLYESSKRATTQVRNWTPKGLCKKARTRGEKPQAKAN